MSHLSSLTLVICVFSLFPVSLWLEIYPILQIFFKELDFGLIIFSIAFLVLNFIHFSSLVDYFLPCDYSGLRWKLRELIFRPFLLYYISTSCTSLPFKHHSPCVPQILIYRVGSRFTVVSTQKTEFILVLLFMSYCIIFLYKQL